MTAASTFLLALVLGRGGAPCEVPAHLQHRFVVMSGAVEVTIASERPRFEAGETIPLYIQYRNTGQDTVRVLRPNTPMNGFSVLPDTCKSSDQPGCDAALFFQHPTIVQPTTDLMVLASGECRSWELPWNGRTNGTAGDRQLLGRFTVLGGIWERPLEMFLYHYSLPEGGAPLVIEIGPVAVEATAWGRVRSLFRR